MTAVSGRPRSRRSLIVSVVLMLVLSFGSLFGVIAAGWSPKLGLDLAGGAQIVLVPTHGAHITKSQLNEAENIIRNRVKGIGVSGATVQIQGSDQIVVQAPGVKDPNYFKNVISTTAQLLFRPVECGAAPFTKPTGKEVLGNTLNLPQCNPTYTLTKEVLDVQPNNTAAGYSVQSIPPDPTFNNYPSLQGYVDATPTYQRARVLLSGIAGSGSYSRYVLAPAVMNGSVVSSASATQSQTGEWVVDLTLDSKGSAQWDAATQTYFHEMMAIELDGIVQSAPLIQPSQSSWTSFGGQVEISGNLTQSQANALATALQYGSLPVPLTALNFELVSPTLGHAALVAGLGAGLAGLALVLLYVILYYRLLGLVVIVGLAITAALLWAIISALGQTSLAPSFDLAGVTGLIVSIGITVDSYIVYFERLKDETRSGRSIRTSLDRGFASAWRTVLAADTVSLLCAVLLYLLAVGSVQGFAFFLGLSTLLDIFVTWFFTRPAVALLGRSERLASMRGMGIAKGLAMNPVVST